MNERSSRLVKVVRTFLFMRYFACYCLLLAVVVVDVVVHYYSNLSQSSIVCLLVVQDLSNKEYTTLYTSHTNIDIHSVCVWVCVCV